jgi:hypothetical protein
MRPNRPHIPSFITSSKSQKTKQQAATTMAHPATLPSEVLHRSFFAASVASSSRFHVLSVSVRRYLRREAPDRKGKKHSSMQIFAQPLYLLGALPGLFASIPSYAQACDSFSATRARIRVANHQVPRPTRPISGTHGRFRDSDPVPAPCASAYGLAAIPAFAWAAITHKSSNITVTPMKAVIEPRSKGGETSTTSAPMILTPSSRRTTCRA